MPRAASIQGTFSRVKIVKLCMDSKEDREEYEKIRNDTNCEVIEKQFNSTPKGVVWMTLEYRTLLGAETQSPDLPSGGVSNDEEDESWP